MNVSSFHTFGTIASCLAALLLASACSRPAAELPENGLVRIGDRVITQSDLEQEAEHRRASGLSALSPEECLNRMLIREALLLKAKSQELAAEPEVRRELDRVLVANLRERELAALLEAVSVTDVELKAAYQARIDQFTKPGFNRVAVLKLELDQKASTAKKQDVMARMVAAREEALEWIKSPDFTLAQGFGKLSIEYSDDTVSRYRGGDIGWFAGQEGPGRLDADVVRATLALPMGALSEIVSATDGLYLTLRTDQRAEQVTPFESARPMLERRLLSEKRAATETRYYSDSLAAAAPEYNTLLLETIRVEKDESLAHAFPALANGLKK